MIMLLIECLSQDSIIRLQSRRSSQVHPGPSVGPPSPLTRNRLDMRGIQIVILGRKMGKSTVLCDQCSRSMG
jgi:hypothetical protein